MNGPGIGVSDGGTASPRDSHQSLRTRAALFGAQMDAAIDGILAVSPAGTVAGYNRRFEEIWQLPPGTVTVGGNLSDLVTRIASWATDPSGLDAELRPEVRRNGRRARMADFSLLDGRKLTVSSAAAFDSSGAYEGRVITFRDHSSVISAGTGSEVARLVNRAEAAERAQGYLLQAMSALAGVSGYVETVQGIADVALPVLGDVFFIDVVDERRRPTRVIARHADRSLQKVTDRLEREFGPEPDGMDPAVQVMRTGQSMLSEHTSDEFLRAVTKNDDHFEIVKQLGFDSYVCVPLFEGDRVFGAVTLVSAGSGRRFGPEDLALIEMLAYPVAQVVSRALRYEEQHGIARILQTSLLPRSLPDVPGLKVASRYVAGTEGAEVGGDFYDLMRTPSGAVGLMVGDVEGHDPSAAAAMGQLRSASRALAGQVRTPAQLVDLMRSSWELIGVDRTATVLYGRLDPSTDELLLASAGHPSPIMVKEGRAEVVSLVPSPPLGAPDPSATAPRTGTAVEWRGTLGAGDLVLLYTDGLVERRGSTVQEGIEALTDLVDEVWNGDPEQVCDSVIAAMSGDLDRLDDVALLAVCRGA